MCTYTIKAPSVSFLVSNEQEYQSMLTKTILSMDVTGVFVVLAFFSHFEDVASQARYKEGMCLEYRAFLRSGDLYCNRDIDPIIGPDGKTHMNQCVMCREVLRQRGYGVNDGTGWSGNTYKDDGCSEYWPYFREGRFPCTRENDPVRDASGKQHNNKCMMCAEKFKNGGSRNSLEKSQVQNGGNKGDDECCEYRSQMRPDGGLSCTRENAPVRDATGHTHTNKCMMCAEKFKKEVREGKIGGGGGQSQDANGNRIAQGNLNQGNENGNNCNQYGGSPQGNSVYNPCSRNERIAQGDYRSYTNCGGMRESIRYNVNNGRQPFNPRKKRQAVGDQELGCDKILADLKKEGTVCNGLWSPVCGSDGRTYSNKCFLCSEIVKSEDNLTLKHEGECPEAVHGMVNCSKYPQTRGRVLCMRSNQEVCGTDGETYSNECMLCDRILKTKSEIGIKNIGPCPQM